MALLRLKKVIVTANAPSQFAAVATATAFPLTSAGNISLMTVHTIGPNENANDEIKTTNPTSITMPAMLVEPFGGALS